MLGESQMSPRVRRAPLRFSRSRGSTLLSDWNDIFGRTDIFAQNDFGSIDNLFDRVVFRGFKRRTAMQFILSLSWLGLIVSMVFASLVVGIVFGAALYLTRSSEQCDFAHYMFISRDTFSTIGYGQDAPENVTQNLIVTLEAYVSVILLALLPGVMFLKIQYPRTKVMWTSRCLISRGVLSIRTINCRTLPLYDVTFKAVMIRREYGQAEDQGGTSDSCDFKLVDIPLENESHLEFDHDLVLFHRIHRSSPLHNLTKRDFERSNICICLIMMGTDQLIQSEVANKVVYLPKDIHWSNGGWWTPMAKRSARASGRASGESRKLSTSEWLAKKGRKAARKGQVILDCSVFDKVTYI
jgi:hypothetical protein